MSSQIRRGAVLSYAAVAFNAIAGLLYTPWMVSTIGTDYYGLYTLAMSIINLFVMDFGLGDAVARYLSKYYAESNSDAANEFLGMILRLYFGIALILFFILLVVFLNIDSIYAKMPLEQMLVFKRLFVIVGLYSVVSFPMASLNGMLTANELFVKLNGCNLAQRVLTVGLIVFLLIMGGGVYVLVLVNAMVGLSFGVVKILILKQCTGVKPVFSRGSNLRIREVLGFSAWTMVMQLAQRFIFTLMPSIIAIVSNSWEIAVFGLASSLEGYVWTVANALNGMFMPKVTRVLHSENAQKSMQELSVRVGRIQLFITGAIVVIFAAIGRDFVRCWVGEKYSTLWTCALLLILPELIELPTMIEGTALVAIGKVRERGLVYLLMAATNLLLGFTLAGPFGAVGACLAICVAYCVRTVGMCALYKRFLGLRLVGFVLDTYANWLFPASITLAIGSAFSHIIPIGGWKSFAFEVGFEIVIYSIACWVFFLKKQEKEQIAQILRSSGVFGGK